MTIFPVADGARLLGIHPKTLHHWFKEANMPLAPHPTDARIKCVAQNHSWCACLLTFHRNFGRLIIDRNR